MIGNHLEPFKFWCQKVLPNVYDDSLSYYEYLCKLNEYLNEVIGQINTLTDNMEDYETDLTAQWTTYRDELSAQWQTYKTYIDNYFNNLDVQQEINNKLDQMAIDGTLNNLIQPYVSTEIASQVTAWLSENVNPVGSAVTVDASLQIYGSAADAQQTGRMVASVYDSTKTYKIDDYVNYNGTIYRCVSNITTAEAFTSAHWRAVRTANDLSTLNNGMAQIDWTSSIVADTGRFWTNDNSRLRESAYAGTTAFHLIRCKKGDKFILKTTGVGEAPCYIVADRAYNVLSSSDTTYVYDGELTISDDDAYWLAVNTVNTALSNFELYQSNINSNKYLENKVTNLTAEIETSLIPSDNIVNINNMSYVNGYYNELGAFTASENYKTFIIPILPNTQYTISAFVHYLTFWNYNDTFVDYIGTASQVTQNRTFTSPNNARFMKATYHKTMDLVYINNFMLILGSTLPSYYTDPYPTLSENVHIDGYSNLLNDIRIRKSVFEPDFQMIGGSQISDVTGVYTTGSSANLCADDIYYPLVNGEKYYFWTDGLLYNVYFYDENKTYITSLTANNNLLSVPTIFNNTNNYKYFRVGCYKSGGVANYLHTLHVRMNLEHRKVVCLGDSMTAGNGASIAYHMYLAYATGWTCLNWGVGGSGWLCNMTGSTTVGKGVEGIAPDNVVPDYSTDFVDAVQVIPTDADLYIVFGGYNDWNTNQTQADMETGVDTVLSYIQNNMPKSRILVVTPPQRYKSGVKDGKTPNSAGLTLHDYGDIIKGVCEEHSVQCIDLYTESGLYPYSSANASQNYNSDGLHPNTNGQKRIFETIVNACTALMNLKTENN